VLEDLEGFYVLFNPTKSGQVKEGSAARPGSTMCDRAAFAPYLRP